MESTGILTVLMKKIIMRMIMKRKRNLQKQSISRLLAIKNITGRRFKLKATIGLLYLMDLSLKYTKLPMMTAMELTMIKHGCNM